MLDWIERRVLRQRELQQGADADLLRDNRKRWKLSWVLLGSSFVLIGVQTMIVLSDPFHRIAVALTMILFVAGHCWDTGPGQKNRFLISLILRNRQTCSSSSPLL